MSELCDELRKLAQTEGNDPIRCSRMHFSEWADDVGRMDAEITRLRFDLVQCRLELETARKISHRLGTERDECRRLLHDAVVEWECGSMVRDKEGIVLADFSAAILSRAWCEAASKAAGGGDE